MVKQRQLSNIQILMWSLAHFCKGLLKVTETIGGTWTGFIKRSKALCIGPKVDNGFQVYKPSSLISMREKKKKKAFYLLKEIWSEIYFNPQWTVRIGTCLCVEEMRVGGNSKMQMCICGVCVIKLRRKDIPLVKVTWGERMYICGPVR